MPSKTSIFGNRIRSGSIPITALGGGVVTSSTQVTQLLPTGVVSSSVQVLRLLPTNTVSSSVQVINFLPTNTVSSSLQINTGSFSGSITSASYASYAPYAPIITERFITGMSYQFQSTDMSQVLVSSRSSADSGSLIIPNNIDAPIPVGSVIGIRNVGASAGVNISKPYTSGQFVTGSTLTLTGVTVGDVIVRQDNGKYVIATNGNFNSSTIGSDIARFGRISLNNIAERGVDIGLPYFSNVTINSPVARLSNGTLVFTYPEGFNSRLGYASYNAATDRYSGVVGASFTFNNSPGAILVGPNDDFVVVGPFTSMNDGTYTIQGLAFFDRTFTLKYTDDTINLPWSTGITTSDGNFVVARSDAPFTISKYSFNRESLGGLSSNPNGRVYDMSLQKDGKIIIAGQFTAIGATSANYVARLNDPLTIDTTFTNPPITSSAYVNSVAVLPSGKILIAGLLTAVNNRVTNVARLNTNGTDDPTYVTPTLSGSSFTSLIVMSASNADDRAFVVGNFNTGSVNPDWRPGAMLLNNDGRIDGFINPSMSGQVQTIFAHPDNTFLIGGQFTTVNNVSRSRFSKLDISGSTWDGFNPVPNSGSINIVYRLANNTIAVGGGFSSIGDKEQHNFTILSSSGLAIPTSSLVLNRSVNAITQQTDGKIIVGGQFTSASYLPRNRLIRVNTNNTADFSYISGSFNNTVWNLVVNPDNSYVVVGVFTSASISTSSLIAAFDANGQLTGSQPSLGAGSAFTIARQTDGKYVVGGNFSLITSSGTVTTASALTRLNSDWSIDGTLPTASADPTANNTVQDITVLPDQKIVVAGNFTTFNNVSTQYVTLLNTNKTIDTRFSSSFNAAVNKVIRESGSNNLVMVGTFTTYAGSTVNRIARVNTSGTLDTTFNPNANSSVSDIIQDASGRYVVGGAFTTLSGSARGFIGRINNNGTLDTTFNPSGSAGSILALKIQTDGRIIVGGTFTSISGSARNRVARINSDGTLDTTFNPNANGSVNDLVIQTDGRIIIGGAFTTVSGSTRNRIARLNSDGTLDSTYDPNASATVNRLFLQSDGKVIAGGDFTTISGSNKLSVARINTNGTLDGFNPMASTGVQAFATQSNGNILMGGAFTQLGGFIKNRFARVEPTGGFAENGFGLAAIALTTAIESNGNILVGGTFSSFPSSNLTRFTSGGVIDPSFIVSASNTVRVVLPQPDGKILVGGDFNAISGSSRGLIARLNSDGTVDTAFNPSASVGGVYHMALQSDNKIVMAGAFTSVSGSARNYIARVNSDGTLDTTFNPNANNIVREVLVQADNKIVLVGDFTQVSSSARNFIARVNSDGTLDTTYTPTASAAILAIASQSSGNHIVVGTFLSMSNGSSITVPTSRVARIHSASGLIDFGFYPEPNGAVNALEMQSDGKILVGGDFSILRGTFTGSRLARLNSDGTIDTTFNTSASATPLTMVAQSDGKILVGGTFTTLSGSTRNYFGRLNSDGTLDTSLNLGNTINGNVNSIVTQSDGRIILGGAFTTVSGSTRNRIARLNSDGTLDSTYDPNANNTIFSLNVQSDGKLIANGAFTTVSGSAVSASVRLNTDGTIDTTYINPRINGAVSTSTLLTDGRVVMGGTFTTIQSSSRPFMGMLNTDGTLDAGFNIIFNDEVNSITQQSDGKYIVTGKFTSASTFLYNGVVRLTASGSIDLTFANPGVNAYVSKSAVQSDGRILIGGGFTVVSGSARNYVARLNTNGTLDTTFNPSPNNVVSAITIQPDGNILIGGNFTTVDGGNTRRNYLVRVNSDGVVDTTFSSSLSGQVNDIAVLSDNKLFIGGAGFSAKLNSNGSRDTTYNNLLGTVYAVVTQSNGNVLVGIPNGISVITPSGSIAPESPSLNLINVGATTAAVLTIAAPTPYRTFIGGAFIGTGSISRYYFAHIDTRPAVSVATYKTVIPAFGEAWLRKVDTNNWVIQSTNY